MDDTALIIFYRKVYGFYKMNSSYNWNSSSTEGKGLGDRRFSVFPHARFIIYDSYIQMSPITYYVDKLGSYGHLILSVFSVVLLMGRPIHVLSFIVGLVTTICSTILMRRSIQELRPSNPDIYSEPTKYEGDDIYGFPSLQASWTFYTIGFLLFSRKHVDRLFMSMMFIAGIVVYNNIKYHCHTFTQLFSGGILGVFIAGIGVEICDFYVMNSPIVLPSSLW
jgi:hypothetical protein